jgi:hypothetical protein
MKRPLALASTVVAAAAPAAGAASKDHVRGCSTKACDKRIGKRWARKHPRARKASVSMRAFVRPYLGFLAKLRACEVRGQPSPYQTNTGNGFYGAYQFTMSSWAAVGGIGVPSNAPPLEQDYRAVRLLNLQGPGAWPVCSQ